MTKQELEIMRIQKMNEEERKKPSLYRWLAEEKGYTEVDFLEMDFWPTWPDEIKKDVKEYEQKYGEDNLLRH